MSINNDPTVNTNSAYFIAPSMNGLKGNETKEQIVKHNRETLLDFGKKANTNLTAIENLQKHTVSTYGMKGKNFFERIIQTIKNLFHLSAYLQNDTRATVSKMTDSATRLRTSLNFKFTPEELKELPTESFNETIKMMEELAPNVESVANSIENAALEQLTRQIRDIVNQLKNLKLYAVESKTLQLLKNGNIEDAYKEIQTIEHLWPEDPKTEKNFPSTLNFTEAEAKYKQMSDFEFVLKKLNELNGENPVQTFGWAYQTWCEAKKTLRDDCPESELSKLLEQCTDERYIQRIKTLSPHVRALKNAILNGTAVTPNDLDMARALCRTGSGKYTVEGLNNYVDDLEKGISVRDELERFNHRLSAHKGQNTALNREKFNTDEKELKTIPENIQKQITRISDEEIKKALESALLQATNKLKTFQSAS